MSNTAFVIEIDDEWVRIARKYPAEEREPIIEFHRTKPHEYEKAEELGG